VKIDAPQGWLVCQSAAVEGEPARGRSDDGGVVNWQMGRDLVQKKAEERWGAGVVEQVSLDLKREFPKM